MGPVTGIDLKQIHELELEKQEVFVIASQRSERGNPGIFKRLPCLAALSCR
jgi:hypothetical protein